MRPGLKKLAVAPRHEPRRRRPVGGPPSTPDEALGDLARAMKQQAHAHRDLDAQRAWRAPARFHLERARAQLKELAVLLPALEDDELDPIRARRVRQTCANCANYLAFLAAHARPRRR